jgi:hypothetical protein
MADNRNSYNERPTQTSSFANKKKTYNKNSDFKNSWSAIVEKDSNTYKYVQKKKEYDYSVDKKNNISLHPPVLSSPITKNNRQVKGKDKIISPKTDTSNTDTPHTPKTDTPDTLDTPHTPKTDTSDTLDTPHTPKTDTSDTPKTDTSDTPKYEDSKCIDVQTDVQENTIDNFTANLKDNFKVITELQNGYKLWINDQEMLGPDNRFIGQSLTRSWNNQSGMRTVKFISQMFETVKDDPEYKFIIQRALPGVQRLSKTYNDKWFGGNLESAALDNIITTFSEKN